MHGSGGGCMGSHCLNATLVSRLQNGDPEGFAKISGQS